MIELGIFAKTFKADKLGALLDKVKAHSLSTVQFNMQCVGLPALPEEIPGNLADQIGQIFREKEVGMTAVSATFNMIHPDTAIVEKGLHSFEQIAGACSAMGTSMISLCTGSRDVEDKWRWHPDNALPEAWADMTKTMRKLLELAEEYDLYLGVEPELANVVSTPAMALQLIDELETDRIKIILDPANLFEEASVGEIREKIAEAIELLAPHIALAHAKDRTTAGEFKAAGKGDVDFPYFVQELKRVGFSGPMVLHGLSEEEVPDCVAYLQSLL
jgi:sugar phosphate isomerase/epimerase